MSVLLAARLFKFQFGSAAERRNIYRQKSLPPIYPH